MAATSTSGQPATDAPQGPASSRARGGGVGSLLKRFLTLREGSIIVVTLVTLIYFSADHLELRLDLELQVAASVLRVPRDHGRRPGVRDDPRRDRPVDRRALSVHAVRVLEDQRGRGASGPERDPGDGGRDADRRDQRLLRRMGWDRLVRRHARDAVLSRRGHADRLAFRADHHPRHIDHRRHHVRAGFRGRHLLGADLGAGDRDRPAGSPVVHAVGALHGRGRR